MGDTFNMSGNFGGAILNIKNKMKNVTQTINQIPNANSEEKQSLETLVDQLNTELQKVPEQHAEQAEEVAKRLESFVETINNNDPDKEDVEYQAGRLRKAAENIKDVLPTVLTIAGSIVSFGLKFVGIS